MYLLSLLLLSFLAVFFFLSQLFPTAGKRQGEKKAKLFRERRKMPAWLGLLMKLTMTKCLAFSFAKLWNIINLYDT